MTRQFSYFVILGEMRTGSNFLEANLNEFPEIECLGELFNPHFIGKPGCLEYMNINLAQREIKPLPLIDAIKENIFGLPGFRFFRDHDPRILENCVSDPSCAKIILTRNPVDSYVSREIARETNQWRLNDLKHAKTAKITFHAADFDKYLHAQQEYQLHLQHALQTSGQTAFYVGYDDIQDVDIINGLVRFLGLPSSKKKSSTATKKQNPESIADKVSNFDEMGAVLRSRDYFQLGKIPNFEPRRGAAIPSYVAANSAPLLFMPVPAGPTDMISNWLADLDGTNPDALAQAFTQKTLRQWKRRAKGHRTFTVIRHPVARLHNAFVRHILLPGPNSFPTIRATLQEVYKLKLPVQDIGDAEAIESHRLALLAFAKVIKGNLSGQTGFRVDGSWASQSECINGMAQFMLPDHIIRESELATDLDILAKSVGAKRCEIKSENDISPIPLKDIYDAEIEAAVKAAYQRDYMMFGFGAWNT